VDAVRERAAAVSRDGAGTVPVDLVTASASGLDPHLTPEAALVQVERIAAVRGIPARELRAMVAKTIEPRSFGLFGEPRVNVLRLNMMLDEMQG
jgi:K+-transporting ATPase ATPase C chain